MGLPGAGKTWLSERLQKYLGSAWYNADKVREMANDWDFSPEGRVRQANRMKTFADYEKSHGRYVICDFVCPTRQTRDAFNPDLVIWLDTIEEGRFEDTNNMFEKPELVDWVVEGFLLDKEIEEIATEIKGYGV
jgi:adenylylsulfate kinase